MAASNDVLCGICEAQHITKCADHWCPECEEGLCSDCQRHHGISKGTRNHEIIPVENYKGLPSFITRINQHCTEHNTKYQHYCRQHDQLCCPVCVSEDHKTCDNFLAIQKIVANAKSSVLFDNMEQSIGDTKINIEKIIQDRQENLAKIQEQKQTFFGQIKREREKINSHLDNLEQKLSAELTTIEQEVKTDIENLLKVLVQKGEEIDVLGEILKAIKANASAMQTFFGNKAIEEEVEKIESNIKSLLSGGNLQQIEMRCTFNTKISDRIRNISSMGSVYVEKYPTSVALKQKEERVKKMLTLQPHHKSISDLKLALKSDFNIPGGGHDNVIRGCIVCPDGKMVLADAGNKRLVVLSTTSDTTCMVEMSVPEPYDITLVDDKTIAMTTVSGLKMINLESMRIGKEFDIGKYGYGITFNKGALIYCHAIRGIEKIDLSNNKMSAFTENKMNAYLTNITSFGNNIYHSNHRDDSVTAYKMNGQILWEFSDKNILRNPRCLTVDNNGNIYVASSDTHSIVVISPDGKIARPLPSRQEGTKYIFGLYFDKKRNILVRAQQSGYVYMYNI